MSGSAVLAADGLEVVLDADAGQVKAIDGLALAVARGETVALVGESGCGKSMTALALMRLLPENGRVAAGRLTLGDVDLLGLPEARMRAVRGGRIGMIFQEPATSLDPVMRVGAQVVEAIEAHTPLRGPAARAKALEWLARVGIPEPERRIDDYPFRLSGGQKQRVMIAIALAAEPEFLVADEPTTALDVTIQAQILDLLEDLQRERGLGLLLITHDLGVVQRMADRVALMYAGQIVEVAPAAAFFAAPSHPYARLLLAALPDAARRGQALAAIPGSVPPLDRAFAGCRFAERCDRAVERCGMEPQALQGVAEGRAVRCWRVAEEVPFAPSPPPFALSLSKRPGEPVHPSVLRQAQDSGRTVARIGPSTSSGRTEGDSGRTGGEGDPQRPEGGTRRTDALLAVEHLRVRFPLRSGLLQRTRGWFDAVDGVSFAIAPGRTLALVGESGCGKTTTGKAIVQLLRGSARIEGRALLDGRDLFGLQGAALQAARREVQIVFQDPYASLDPRMRVAELLEEGLVALRPELDAAARTARIARLAEQVGLRPDWLQRHPHAFSGGQRQRIAIARALAVGPRLLVLDEPTSALDVSVQAQILNLLRDLQRTLGLAYLFITHNIGVVEYIADAVAVMDAGRIVEAGPAEQVLGAPRSAVTRALLDAVPRLR